MTNERFKVYLLLTKPGIVLGNLFAAIGAFLLASRGSVDWRLMISTIAGTGLIIASAGVVNNYLDRRIDALMERTKKRALASGKVPVGNALLYGFILGVLGFGLLLWQTNYKTAAVGLFGYLSYLFLYGWAKRKTVHGTLIGTLPGATPPLAGYVAMTDRYDWTALWLFLIIVFWQMPHFYAIAVRRLEDYRAAHIPVLPVARNVRSTIIQMLGYVLLFWIACLQLYLAGGVSMVFPIMMSLAALYWLIHTYKGFTSSDLKLWARANMKVSLRALMLLSLLWSINHWLL